MIGLPILTAVIGVAMLGVQAGVTQLRLQDEASLQARYASLGGDIEDVIEDGDLLCVEARHTLDRGLWAVDPLELSARSCALNPTPPRGTDESTR